MKIYISGPITGVEGYKKHFSRAEEYLMKKGHTVMNPAKVNSNLPEGTTYDEYMDMSLCMLEMCEAIFMLEGWEESEGANAELRYAEQNRHTIMFEGGRG